MYISFLNNMSTKLFSLPFVFGFLLLILPSCNKNVIEEGNQTSYVVSLSLIGDVSMTTEPLTKGTSTNDLYGINVYYNADKGNEITNVYACGLFDNVDDMTITLLSGYKYKFQCTLIKDGKTRIQQGSTPGWYAAPFQMQLGNAFVMGQRITGISSSECDIVGSSTSRQTKELDRFYGELTDYVPVQNETIDIDLYRVSFGVKLIIIGLVDDGTLSVRCRMWRNAWKETFLSMSTSVNMEGDVCVYTFPYIVDCWTAHDNYSQEGEIELGYTSNRGTVWNKSYTKDVYWKRNILSTVTINVSPDLSNADINVSEESPGADNEISVGIGNDGSVQTL